MTERDPIERLEASDGLPIEPSPEFAEELRIMLDLRLRVPDQSPPANGTSSTEPTGSGEQRPDRLQTLVLGLLGVLACLVLALVAFIAV